MHPDVGLSNILYRERKKTISGGSPLKRAHRSAVAGSLVSSELGTKVGKGKETMGIVETFLVFAMAAFDLAVVAGRIGANELVADAQLFGSCFKERFAVALTVGETVGKLKTVVSLDAFHFDSAPLESRNNLPEKVGRGIGGLFRVRSQDAETGVFVDRGVLE